MNNSLFPFQTETLSTSLTSPAAPYAPWVFLSPSADCDTKQASYSDADTNTLATACESSGYLIGVSLRLVPPEAESCVRVHFPDGVKPSSADVVATHDDSVLIHIAFEHGQRNLFNIISFEQDQRRTYTDDYFVYSAGVAATATLRPPSLSLLPKRYHMTYHDAISLLRLGEDDLMVAALEMVPASNERDRLGWPTRTAPELVLLRSDKWVVKRPAISHGGEHLSRWRWNFNSVVHAGDGSLLCWVDLSHGLLLSDVLEETPKLRYVPLPETPSPVMCRNVCATAAAFSPCLHGYTINAWTLALEEDMVWVMDGVLDATELWALDAYKGLPRVRLDYPVVSMDDPNIVSFVVCDWAEWLIMVDMRNKAILSVYRYPEGRVHGSYGRPLLPSTVSDFFNFYPNCNHGMSSSTSIAGMDMETATVDHKEEQLIVSGDGSSNSVRRQSSDISPAVPNVAFPEAAILLALQDIPSLARVDMLKAYSILVHDSNSNGCQLRALLALPMSLRKDWLSMEIEASEACSTCSSCRANMHVTNA
ncbi:unnamed protein product [Urochloa decumbens]|uniref:DUF1618 domain-containing protein n=1 Tax=Urochloa decumbens TaxID=240449 RepID=A0ABC9B5F7_9POAL